MSGISVDYCLPQHWTRQNPEMMRFVNLKVTENVPRKNEELGKESANNVKYNTWRSEQHFKKADSIDKVNGEKVNDKIPTMPNGAKNLLTSDSQLTSNMVGDVLDYAAYKAKTYVGVADLSVHEGLNGKYTARLRTLGQIAEDWRAELRAAKT